MIEVTADRPSNRTVALFASAAGVTGILANLLLVVMFVMLGAGREADAMPFGTANDLVGSLGSALMVPVALALGAWLPDRLACRVVQALGVAAMAVLVVGGPVLVLGLLSFEAQSPIMVSAYVVLGLWLFLLNRWLRLSGDLPLRLTRFGESLGALVLAAGAVAVLGLLLPWMSWPQLILFGASGVLGIIGMLGTPFWFLFLGRHLFWLRSPAEDARRIEIPG